MRAMDADQLERRHKQLLALQYSLAVELVTVEQQLRAVGRWGRAGRPRKAPTHTPAEARECHTRYQNGDRTDWVVTGYRQYKRDHKRQQRAVDG